MSRLASWLGITTFRVKLLLVILGVALISLLLTSITMTLISIANAKQNFQTLIGEKAEILSYNLVPTLLFDDARGAEQILLSLKTDANIHYAEVLKLDAESGELVSVTRYARPGVSHQRETDGTGDATGLIGAMLIESYPINFEEERLGQLHLHAEFRQLQTLLYRSITIAVITLVVSLLIAMVIAWQVQKILLRPLQSLIDTTQRVTDQHDFGIRAPTLADQEFMRLGESFNLMLAKIERHDARRQVTAAEIQRLNSELEDKVKVRTSALEHSNTSLKAALNELKLSQKQLVEQEKMASLGQLVAGISHEINTPIGIGVTAASHLKYLTTDLRRAFDNKTLTSKGMNLYIENAEESVGMVLNNLDRASDLISSFKQVAVDQSADKIRRFELPGYLQEILTTLRPELKKVPYQVHVQCADIEVNANAGALYQVLTNLIMNSLNHAFDGRDSGNIYIECEAREGWVNMDYRDDGIGVPDEHMSKLFEPFFTTKRDQGGSGLGAHLIYNLVTRSLHGEIAASQAPESGLAIAIRFPQHQ